ncbi:peptidase [Pseudomarimonas arenosa]|uniref:Peptidase n=1 Tax=Pseudomarimonas arenosa TaxID=2774145 RepID=A0AAW3ZGE4_9GAMM|nr:peptidase [Pseudomarimonas arenosa]MBD8525118.1 peptidase [Pseudomarimonas arenosa]
MTYCVGLYLDQGLVMLADTRTNAGMDNISCFGKQYVFQRAGERAIVAMTAGNLAVSQAVMNLIQDGLKHPESGEQETIYSVPSMFAAASLVGEAVRRVYRTHGEAMQDQGVSFDVSVLLGGQLKDRTMRLFQVYSAGNFIAATRDTPFLQIGEHKYGKPILDRAVSPDTSLLDGVKLGLISMDSTLRSNLGVGLPLDLMVYPKDSLDLSRCWRIGENDEYFSQLRASWSDALRQAYRTLPNPPYPL